VRKKLGSQPMTSFLRPQIGFVRSKVEGVVITTWPYFVPVGHSSRPRYAGYPSFLPVQAVVPVTYKDQFIANTYTTEAAWLPQFEMC